MWTDSSDLFKFYQLIHYPIKMLDCRVNIVHFLVFVFDAKLALMKTVLNFRPTISGAHRVY